MKAVLLSVALSLLSLAGSIALANEHETAFANCRDALEASAGDPVKVTIYEELHDDPQDEARRVQLLQGASSADYILGSEGVVYGQTGHLHTLSVGHEGIPAGTVQSGILGLERDVTFNLTTAVSNAIIIDENIEHVRKAVTERKPVPELLEAAEALLHSQQIFAGKIINSASGQAAWRKLRAQRRFSSANAEAIAREIDASISHINEYGLGDYSQVHPGAGPWGDPGALTEVSRAYAMAVIDQTREGADAKLLGQLDVAERALDDKHGAGKKFLNDSALRMRSNSFAVSAADIIAAAVKEGKQAKFIMGEKHGPQVEDILREELGNLIDLHIVRSNSPDSDPLRDHKNEEWQKIRDLKGRLKSTSEGATRRRLVLEIQQSQAVVGMLESMTEILPATGRVIGKPKAVQYGQAVMKANQIGLGELGEDKATPARKGNYTPEQMQRQAISLLQAGMSREDVTKLFRAGVIGFDIDDLYTP